MEFYAQCETELSCNAVNNSSQSFELIFSEGLLG